jgi:uncharacterized membrane protein YgcG
MKRSFLAVTAALSTLALHLLSAQAPAKQPPPEAPLPPLKVEFKPDYPAAPADGIYVSDRGIVLSVEEQKNINKLAAKVKFSSGVPVYIVTIRSLETMGADPVLGLDGFAKEVFKRWSVASAKDNRGVLMVLSRDEADARVLLGAGWGGTQDAAAARIAAETLAPALKTGRAGPAILDAINKVDAMLTAAGYSSELPVPASDATSGRLVGAPAPTVVPQSPGGLSRLGSWEWIIIAGVALVIFVIAGLVLLATRRSAQARQ